MPDSSNKKNSNRKKDHQSTDDNTLITASIKAYLEEYKERKKLNQDNIEIISSFLEEYLQTFLVIGYNYDGELISYSHGKTQAQMDALNTGLFRFINQHAMKPPTIPGYGQAEV